VARAAGDGDAAVVSFAQDAAMRAVNFGQGDAAALNRAKGDFTPEAWADVMRHMEGFLDARGAPTFASSFVPSKGATVFGRENGIVHLRIPGTLTQTQNQSRTTYRAALEVDAGGAPTKVHRLKQVTCLGASTACE
jgi:hypothetical protein